MGQVIQLDATTVLFKSDDKNDLAEIIDFVTKKDKFERVHSFLEFASRNHVLSENYQFNREECYDRPNVH